MFITEDPMPDDGVKQNHFDVLIHKFRIDKHCFIITIMAVLSHPAHKLLRRPNFLKKNLCLMWSTFGVLIYLCSHL